VASFSISDVEPLGSTTTELVNIQTWTINRGHMVTCFAQAERKSRHMQVWQNT